MTSDKELVERLFAAAKADGILSISGAQAALLDAIQRIEKYVE